MKQENVSREAIFKKGSFSLFCFFLQQILGLERKRLIRHRIVVHFENLSVLT